MRRWTRPMVVAELSLQLAFQEPVGLFLALFLCQRTVVVALLGT